MIDEGAWVIDFQSKDGTTSIEHLNGVPWWEAKRPRRWHRCRPQTRGWVNWTQTERCACGAIRNADWRRWDERNSRRTS